MRPYFVALVFGLTALAPMGCKSCHSCGTVPPPLPVPVQSNPPPFAPAPVAPNVGAMLPATDPDLLQANPAPLPAQTTLPTSFNRLTSLSR